MARSCDRTRAIRAGVVGTLLATGLMVGTGSAHADPSETATATAAPTPAATATAVPSATPKPTVSVSGGVQTPTEAPAAATGDVLDQLAEEYAVGSGGGQLSNLLKMSLKLRAMGFKPSKANLAEIAQAMDYRPNQIPLIDALKDTIAYQQKIRAQMEILQQYQKQQGANSAVMGAGQMPGDSNPANLPGAPQPNSPAAPAAPTP